MLNRIKIVGRYKYRRLRLATEPGKMPAQWKVPSAEPDPKVVTNPRVLPPLHEAMHPYQRHSDERIAELQSFGTFYDPHFNPHLHEGRNQVNPDEEPFNAIYAGNESTEGGQQYTSVRDVTTPELWSHVENLARHKIAPDVQRRKPGEPITKLPSGFVPPPEEAPDLPYFIARTRNHLLPVYYELNSDPEKCVTIVKNIMGDIWKFEEELRSHLESLKYSGEKILSSVMEPDEMVQFRGKHIHQIVDWLHQQGF